MKPRKTSAHSPRLLAILSESETLVKKIVICLMSGSTFFSCPYTALQTADDLQTSTRAKSSPASPPLCAIFTSASSIFRSQAWLTHFPFSPEQLPHPSGCSRLSNNTILPTFHPPRARFSFSTFFADWPPGNEDGVIDVQNADEVPCRALAPPLTACWLGSSPQNSGLDLVKDEREVLPIS